MQAGAGNAAANLSFSFDTIGNLTARADATQSLSEAFTYDALNRLTQTQIAGGAAKTVSYDAIGNITSKSDTGAYAYAAPGGALPHAVAAITPSGTGTLNTTYAYDANGNMSAGGGRSTSWTAANMVAQITQGASTVTFAYGPEHARIKQVTASATTYYFSDAASGVSFEKVLGTGGTTQWNEYLIADGKMAGEHYTLISASLVTTTKTRYFTGDHLGSIAVITDESAAVVERLSYDAWGKRRFANGSDDPSGSITSQTTRGFTGHEMIDQVGLINMNGRVQDPVLGKFLSADPNIPDPEDSQSFNRYSYVTNNPLSLTDPSGFYFGSLDEFPDFGSTNFPVIDNLPPRYTTAPSTGYTDFSGGIENVVVIAGLRTYAVTDFAFHGSFIQSLLATSLLASTALQSAQGANAMPAGAQAAATASTQTSDSKSSAKNNAAQRNGNDAKSGANNNPVSEDPTKIEEIVVTPKPRVSSNDNHQVVEAGFPLPERPWGVVAGGVFGSTMPTISKRFVTRGAAAGTSPLGSLLRGRLGEFSKQRWAPTYKDWFGKGVLDRGAFVARWGTAAAVLALTVDIATAQDKGRAAAADVGSLVGGTAGAVLGSAIGGPVGGIVGSFVGSYLGDLAGTAIYNSFYPQDPIDERRSYVP